MTSLRCENVNHQEQPTFSFIISNPSPSTCEGGIMSDGGRLLGGRYFDGYTL